MVLCFWLCNHWPERLQVKEEPGLMNSQPGQESRPNPEGGPYRALTNWWRKIRLMIYKTIGSVGPEKVVSAVHGISVIAQQSTASKLEMRRDIWDLLHIMFDFIVLRNQLVREAFRMTLRILAWATGGRLHHHWGEGQIWEGRIIFLWIFSARYWWNLWV